MAKKHLDVPVDHSRYGEPFTDDLTRYPWHHRPNIFYRSTTTIDKRVVTFVRDFELQAVIMYVGLYPIPENVKGMMSLKGDFDGEHPMTDEPWTLDDIQHSPRWGMREMQLYAQVYGEPQACLHRRHADVIPSLDRSPWIPNLTPQVKMRVLETTIDDKLGELESQSI